MEKRIVASILVLLLVPTLVMAGTVTRILPEEVETGEEFEVILDVVLDNETYYLIDEIYPPQCGIEPNKNQEPNQEIGDIRHGHIYWAYFIGASDIQLKYTLKAPSEPTELVFKGMSGFEPFVIKEVAGDTTLQVVHTCISQADFQDNMFLWLQGKLSMNAILLVMNNKCE